MASVRKIMRVCTCLWGGVYNPIIPVFKVPPKEWRPERHDRTRGISVTKGYIDFFQPDVYVEAKVGLLEEAGLGALRKKHTIEPVVLSLSEMLAVQDNRDWSEPVFGLNITDVYGHLYKTEQRFEHRDKISSILVKPERGSGLVEAVFGAFPSQKDAAYITQEYKGVFAPKELEATPETLIEAFKNLPNTPLRVTRHGLDFQRYWYHDLVIYVFDSVCATDLIDLWNLRLEPRPVLPVPIKWVGDVTDFLQSVIKAQHRPVKGNPRGIMHRCTVEFGRSIPKSEAEKTAETLGKGLPKGCMSIKFWRNRIWDPKEENRSDYQEFLKITAAEEHTTINAKKDEEISGTFKTLSPEFAEPYGGHNMRWVNAVSVSTYSRENIATVFPYNTYDRHWPRLRLIGEEVIVGQEGWIFGQRFNRSSESIKFLSKEDAIIGALAGLDITAKLSDPGHIAKQILERLGGMWGAHLLADIEIIKLLNKMAVAVRRRKNADNSEEEHFENWSAPTKTWEMLLAKNSKSRRGPKLEDFTKRNVIKLGLETCCPQCQGKNWHGLDAVNYQIICERCLNPYDFPQANGKIREWKYRVIGPFSVPDYARGSYSALLTLRALDCIGLRSSRGDTTFSTAMDFEFDGIKSEVDFVALRGRGTIRDYSPPPELIIGETKSLGSGDLIKKSDITKLRRIAKKLPGAIFVISVMRDKFTDTEKKTIKPFVQWGRRADKNGRCMNPVILLTSHELFVDHLINADWKKLGEPYTKYTDYEHTKDLYSFAQATQAIHLGLPSFFTTRSTKRKARIKKKG